MSRFIALHCGDETAALLSQHPNAFLLLTQIAMRAKWKDCAITRLKAGQAFIGDWREAGLKSEKAYRHAKSILSDCKLATFQGANKGTIATLSDSKVFSISADGRGGQTGGQGDSPGADEGRTRGGQGATNHTDIQNTPNTPSERASLPEVESTGRRFDDHTAIQTRIAALRPEWNRPVHWGGSELHHLHAALGQFHELTDGDWDMLKRFLAAQLDPAAGYWQPNNRSKFVETFADVFASATRWDLKRRPSPRPAPVSVTKAQHEPTDEDKAALLEFLKGPGLLKAQI